MDLLRQNRFMFMAGTLDEDRRKVMRVADSYKEAGIDNTKFVSVANTDRKMPGVSYFDDAVKFLDARPVVAEASE